MFNFGANKTASTSTAPAAPSILFTSATPQLSATSQQPTSTFSFGAPAQPAANTTAQPAAGTSGTSLFGNTTGQQPGQQQQQSQPAAGTGSSLFGGTSGGGLFGGGASNNQQQQQAQQPAAAGTGGSLFGGGGLFGAKPATPAGQTGTTSFGTSSLFGSQQQQQPQQQQQGQQPGQSTVGFGTSSLFGQNNQQQQQQQQPQQSNLFGQSTTQLLFGSQAAQNATQQSTAGNQGGMQGSTRFTDLPEGHQKVFEDLNTFIKQQKEKANGIDTSKVGAAIRQTSADAHSGHREIQVLSQSHKAIAEAIKKQIAKNKEAEATLITIMTLVDAAVKSADGRQTIVRPNFDRDFPTSFFVKTAAQLEERVQRYKTSISQLRRAVESLASSDDGPSPEVVGQTIQNHQNAIITLAGQIEHLDTRLNACRAGFTAVYQELNNTARDPFEMERERQGEPPRIR